MAIIGLRHPVASPITAETKGVVPTYGTGFVIGHGIQADVTYNTRDNPLYGDDVTIENDKGITDADITLEVDDLEDTVRVALLGEVGVGTDNADGYDLKDKNPPYVGFGYIRVKMKDNVKKYEGFWIFKAQFSIASDSGTTMREQIEWGTPTCNGKGFAIDVDGSGEPSVRRRKVFTTEAAAITWLNGLAGITSTSTNATVNSNP